MGTLDDAREAYKLREWPRARSLFEAAKDAGEDLDGEDLYQLSDAAWWEGDTERTIKYCEAAYRRYLVAENPRRAAMAATDIALVLFLRGDEAAGSGWVGRAQRHLEGESECAEQGWITYLLAVEGELDGVITAAEPASYAAIIDAAQRVQALGRDHGDSTLTAVGILGEGRTLVKAGRVREGLALLDEAMVAALTDELAPVWIGNIYCHLMAAAYELGDFRRARAWTDATNRWLETLPAAVVYQGICRVHRSQLDQLAGSWDRAEDAAVGVCADLADIHKAITGEAHYQIGEIRRLRGDSEKAEDAYKRAHELGRDPQPGLALLRLAQGRLSVASASIRSALIAETRTLRRARLLDAQTEIALEANDVATAERACTELEEIASAYQSSGLEVAARHARGAILLASGHPEDAMPILWEACRTWTDIDAPYDCARVRVLLAKAYGALGDEEAMIRELDSAAATFTRLGAAPDLTRLEMLRKEPAFPGGLSSREVEVLSLIAEGKSNRDVAAELVISEKTVSRHLSNIFAKLGLSSRAAAAAFAVEHRLTRPRT